MKVPVEVQVGVGAKPAGAIYSYIICLFRLFVCFLYFDFPGGKVFPSRSADAHDEVRTSPQFRHKMLIYLYFKF